MRASKNVVEPRVKDTYNIQARKNGPTSEHGCLAQLGEHLFDVQEVTGSIPVAPTMLKRKSAPGAVFSCLLPLDLVDGLRKSVADVQDDLSAAYAKQPVGHFGDGGVVSNNHDGLAVFMCLFF